MYPPSGILSSAGLDAATVRVLTGVTDVDAVPLRPAPAWMRRLWRGSTAAMTLPWGIYVAPDRLVRSDLAVLLIHELVHVRQWHRLGRWGFLRRYVGDYLSGRWRGLGHDAAYRAIRFEREARIVVAKHLAATPDA